MANQFLTLCKSYKNKLFPLKGVKRRLFLGLVLLCALGVLAFNASKILTKGTQEALSYALSEEGVTNITISTVSPSWHSLDIDHLSFDIPAEKINVTLEHTKLTFSSFISLLKGHLTTLILDKPEIRVGDTPLTINSEQIRHALHTVFRELSKLEEAEIRLGKLFYHDFTPLDLSFHRISDQEMELTLSHSEISQITFRLLKDKENMLKLLCTSPYFEQKNEKLHFSFQDLALSLIEKDRPNPAVTTSLPPLDIQGRAILTSLEFSFSELSTPIHLKKPLSLEFNVSHHWDNPKNNMYTLISGPVSQGTINPLLTLKGMSSVQENSFSLSLTSQSFNPLQWINIQEALSKMIPKLTIDSINLSLTASGKIPLSKEFHSFSLENLILDQAVFNLSNMNLHYDTYYLKEAQTILKMDPVHLTKTKNNQSLTFQRLSIDSIILENGALLYSLDFSKDKNLFPTINSFQFSTLGGSFILDRFNWNDPRKPINGLTMSAAFNNVNLTPLINLTDVPTLSVSGRMNGKGIFTMDQEGITILDMTAASLPGGGTLHYIAPASMRSPESKLILQALEDFRYTQLTMNIKPTNLQKKKSQGIIKILGSSPKVLNGYPFEINMNVTGKLQELISKGLNIY